MNTTGKIIKCLNEELGNYKQPVTELSKTDAENIFIIDDTLMFDWDEVSSFTAAINHLAWMQFTILLKTMN